MRRELIFIAAVVVSIGGTEVLAGTPVVRADLAVSVVVSPLTVSPGGTATVWLTLHNAGPDTAGASQPDNPLPNLVLQRGFRLAQSSDRGPYEIQGPIAGCVIAEDIVGPFADLSFGLVWSFYFPPILAGESRTCSFEIEFARQPLESFDTFWRTATSSEDLNPSNNQIAYRFVVGNPTNLATPIPTLSLLAKLLLVVGLLVVGARRSLALLRH